MEKKIYTIEIADVQLSVMSDEKEDFVNGIVEKLDSEIRDLSVRNKSCSKLDAAILCAIDYCSEMLKREKRVRNLEAQISLYDANLRRMREENEKLMKLAGHDAADAGETFDLAEPDSAEEITAEASGETVHTHDSDDTEASSLATHEEANTEAVPDKIRQLEDLLKNRKRSS